MGEIRGDYAPGTFNLYYGVDSEEWRNSVGELFSDGRKYYLQNTFPELFHFDYWNPYPNKNPNNRGKGYKYVKNFNDTHHNSNINMWNYLWGKQDLSTTIDKQGSLQLEWEEIEEGEELNIAKDEIWKFEMQGSLERGTYEKHFGEPGPLSEVNCPSCWHNGKFNMVIINRNVGSQHEHFSHMEPIIWTDDFKVGGKYYQNYSLHYPLNNEDGSGSEPPSFILEQNELQERKEKSENIPNPNIDPVQYNRVAAACSPASSLLDCQINNVRSTINKEKEEFISYMKNEMTKVYSSSIERYEERFSGFPAPNEMTDKQWNNMWDIYNDYKK